MEELGRICLQLQILRQGVPRKAHYERGLQILAGEAMKIEVENLHEFLTDNELMKME